jgi:hypothetical protein
LLSLKDYDFYTRLLVLLSIRGSTGKQPQRLLLTALPISISLSSNMPNPKQHEPQPSVSDRVTRDVDTWLLFGSQSFFGVDSPGPSSYTAISSIGSQPQSDHKSPPGWKFGTANRFKVRRSDGLYS